MKLAVITDSSAYLSAKTLQREDLYVLDIPVNIDGEEYVEGINLTAEEFYQKMAQASELPKTSQPSIAKLDEILTSLKEQGYTHVLGLFLSSGISGFYQNIQYMIEEYEGLTIAFPDTFIQDKLAIQISHTSAFIMVDDLDHLVKGGRLSNGAAILGNLLSIKPILYFNDQGVIEVYEKVRTEKKATKRLIEIIKEATASGQYRIIVIHGNAPEKAEELRQHLLESGVGTDVSLATFGSVIGTHLGAGSIALGYIPVI